MKWAALLLRLRVRRGARWYPYLHVACRFRWRRRCILRWLRRQENHSMTVMAHFYAQMGYERRGAVCYHLSLIWRLHIIWAVLCDCRGAAPSETRTYFDVEGVTVGWSNGRRAMRFRRQQGLRRSLWVHPEGNWHLPPNYWHREPPMPIVRRNVPPCGSNSGPDDITWGPDFIPQIYQYDLHFRFFPVGSSKSEYPLILDRMYILEHDNPLSLSDFNISPIPSTISVKRTQVALRWIQML